MTLPLRRKTPAAAASVVAIQKQLLVVAPPTTAVLVGEEAPNVVGGCSDDATEQQAESKKKKTAWAARRPRPSRLDIPVVDVDAGEVAAGWAAAAAASAKEADLKEVEGEGFRLASRAGPRHAMEDAYAVVTDKHGGDSELVIFFICVANDLINYLLDLILLMRKFVYYLIFFPSSLIKKYFPA